MNYEKILAAFKSAIVTCLNKYVDKNGRAARPEFWFFFMVSFLISTMAASWGISLVAVILLIPTVMVAIRRLHDMDKSGYWICLALIPVLGNLALLYILTQQGTEGDNQFGPEPTENVSFGFDNGSSAASFGSEEFNRDKYEHDAQDAEYHETVDDHSGQEVDRPDDEPQRDRYGRLIGEKKAKHKKDDDFLEG